MSTITVASGENHHYQKNVQLFYSAFIETLIQFIEISHYTHPIQQGFAPTPPLTYNLLGVSLVGIRNFVPTFLDIYPDIIPNLIERVQATGL